MKTGSSLGPKTVTEGLISNKGIKKKLVESYSVSLTRKVSRLVY